MGTFSPTAHPEAAWPPSASTPGGRIQSSQGWLQAQACSSFALSCYSFIAVAAYFGLSLVLLGLGSKLYVHLMGLLKKPCKDPLTKVESLNLEVTEEQVQALLAQTASYINTAAATTKRLLLVEDYLESAKFALVAYLATFLGAIMNSLTLVVIAWVAAFSLPTVYAAKQKEVDAMLATAPTHYTALNAKLV